MCFLIYALSAFDCVLACARLYMSVQVSRTVYLLVFLIVLRSVVMWVRAIAPTPAPPEEAGLDNDLFHTYKKPPAPLPPVAMRGPPAKSRSLRLEEKDR